MSSVTTADTQAGQRLTPEGPTMAARVRRKLSTRTASIVSVIIAVFWTIPTFGLFISSLRPEDQIKTTGWWTFFTHPSLTLQNYNDVVFGESNSSGRLASYFVEQAARRHGRSVPRISACLSGSGIGSDVPVIAGCHS